MDAPAARYPQQVGPPPQRHGLDVRKRFSDKQGGGGLSPSLRPCMATIQTTLHAMTISHDEKN